MGKHGIGKVSTTIAPAFDGSGSTAVTYHSTAVVTFNRDIIRLNSGGYRTVTTKRRMNEVAQAFSLGYRVWQTNHEWYVYWQGNKYTFYDGMILWRDEGKVTQSEKHGCIRIQPVE